MGSVFLGSTPKRQNHHAPKRSRRVTTQTPPEKRRRRAQGRSSSDRSVEPSMRPRENMCGFMNKLLKFQMKPNAAVSKAQEPTLRSALV